MKRKRFSFLLMLGLCITMLAAGTVQAGVVPSGMSDSYRSGSYYGRLTNVLWGSPNASQPERLAAVALSQKGYNSCAVKNNYTGDEAAGSSGGKTYNEYSRWCGANGLDWCASFVSWCAYMAGIPTSVIPRSAGAGTYRSCGTQHIIWSSDFSTYIDYQPKKGDLMLAMPYRLVNGDYAHYNSYEKTAHVAIVAEDATQRDGNGGWIFTTIERRGNTVGSRTMSTQIRAGGTSEPGTHYVQMFVTPDYQANDRVPPAGCSVDIYSADYRPGSPVTLTPTASGASYFLLTVRDAADTGTIYFSKSDFTGPVTFTPSKNGEYVVWVNALSPSGGMAKCYSGFEISDHTHAWGAGSVTTAPTCVRTGVRTYTCGICGKTRTESIPVLATHTWNAGTVTRAATCTAEGLRTYTCIYDSGHTRTEIIPKLAHSPGQAVRENVRAATCTGQGSYDEAVYCTVCRALTSRKTVTLAPAGHNWINGKVTKEPTAATAGIRTYTCKVCKVKRTEPIPKLKADDQTIPITQAPSVKTAEKKILRMSGDEAPGSARFNILQLQSGKVTGSSIQLKWKKVKGATGYIVYGAACGQKNRRLKILNTGSRTSWTRTGLKKGKYYKFFVLATAKKGSERRVIATSVMIHAVTKGGSTGNYKSVKLTSYRNKAAVVKVGKRITVRAKAVSGGSRVKSHRALRFESTNRAVAVVGEKSGKVRAKRAGTCFIYVYAQNGVCQRVKIIVKK